MLTVINKLNRYFIKQKLVKLIHFLIKHPFRSLQIISNLIGNSRECYICNKTFSHFSKYGGGSKNMPDFMKKLDIVGSDLDNFGCNFCGSTDRERHLFMFFDKINLWEKITNSKILHFAPEKNLSIKIESLNPHLYIKGDLNNIYENIKKIDATKIPYDNETFDFVICNHVLEHISNYISALNEIYRVLKPNGIAILQTPYSKLLSRNFEDGNINTDEQRQYFYGEPDHYRIFSENHLYDDMEKTGFFLQVAKNSDYFDEQLSHYYGINIKEDLIQVTKPC
jgi:SAM-dependent methyltransferase